MYIPNAVILKNSYANRRGLYRYHHRQTDGYKIVSDYLFDLVAKRKEIPKIIHLKSLQQSIAEE